MEKLVHLTDRFGNHLKAVDVFLIKSFVRHGHDTRIVFHDGTEILFGDSLEQTSKQVEEQCNFESGDLPLLMLPLVPQ